MGIASPRPKQGQRQRPGTQAAPPTDRPVSTLVMSLDACTEVLHAIQAVRIATPPTSARRLRRKVATPEAAPEQGPVSDLEDSEEEVGEDGWTASQVEALHKWYHLLNPQLPDFWQQVANMVGRSKQECMDKVVDVDVLYCTYKGAPCKRIVEFARVYVDNVCLIATHQSTQHFEGMEQGALASRSKAVRPPRYLAALREDAPPPALAGRGVGPAAVRRAARTAWWAQRAEQRGLTVLEEDEDGDGERDEFLAEMAEQERTDRYIDNLRKRSKLLRSRGAWAAAKRGAAKPVAKVAKPPQGADPTAIARRLLAQTQRSDEDEEEEEVDEYMSASEDDFHSAL